MEEKKEKDNEEKNTKKKIGKIASYIVMGIGLVIGLSIIIFGLIRYVSAPKQIEANNKRLEEITEEINNIHADQSKEFKDNGFSKEYYSYATKLEKLQKEKSDINSKNFDLENRSMMFSIVPGLMAIIFGFVFGTVIKNIVDPPTVGKLIDENFGIDIKELGKDLTNKMASVDVEPEYKTLKCPNCGNNLDGEEKTKCKYCGATLEKVYKKKKKETK